MHSHACCVVLPACENECKPQLLQPSIPLRSLYFPSSHKLHGSFPITCLNLPREHARHTDLKKPRSLQDCSNEKPGAHLHDDRLSEPDSELELVGQDKHCVCPG